MLNVFIRSRTNLLACIPHSSVCEIICSHAFIFFVDEKLLLHEFLFRPFANESPKILSLFIPFIVTSCLIHVPISAITHDTTTSNPSISYSPIMRCLSLLDASDRESREGSWNYARHISGWDVGFEYYWWKLHKGHWDSRMDKPHQSWLFAESVSARERICTIFWGKHYRK